MTFLDLIQTLIGGAIGVLLALWLHHRNRCPRCKAKAFKVYSGRKGPICRECGYEEGVP